MTTGARLRLLAWTALLGSTGGLCNVPVFRYALERWPASPYEAVLFHRGPLPPETEALLREIEASPANLVVERADVGGTLEGSLRDLWKGQKDPPLPWMVVRFPMAEEGIPPAWAGRPEAGPLRALIDSPARQEIVRRLVRGDSAVWLLVECGDPGQDEAAARLLGTQLAELEKTIRLPECDPDEMPLLSDVPLRIAFSVLRLSRGDPAEKEFLGMLSRAGGDLAEGKRPVALPIFGRGRALWPLSGERLCAEEIADTAEFIAGPCSCQVKEMNPGLDLLFKADWEELLSSPAPGEAVAPAAPPPASPGMEAPAPGPFLWIGLGALAGLILLAGAVLLLRGLRSPGAGGPPGPRSAP